jgi:hypothetical protein
MQALGADLSAYEDGEQHVEASWVASPSTRSRVLNTAQDVVFVTAADISDHPAMVEYARADGHRLVVVPANVARKLLNQSDTSGAPVRTLDVFAHHRSEQFVFTFIEEAELSSSERALLHCVSDALEMASVKRRWPVLVTETMRPSVFGTEDRKSVV